MTPPRPRLFDNPWVGLLTGLAIRRPWRGEHLLHGAVLVVAATVLGLWIAAAAKDDARLVEIAAGLSYIVCVLVAFLAPSLGAAARTLLDRHVLLAESFATPVPMLGYRAAVKARVALQAAGAGLLAGAVAAGLATLIALAPKRFDELTNSMGLLTTYLRVLRLQTLDDSGVLWPALVVGGMLVVNYAAGFYFNATVLACVCQLRGLVRLQGAILTALLIALMPLMIVVRAVVIYQFGIQSTTPTWWDMPWRHLINVLVGCELLYAALRLGLAEWLWARRFPPSFEETRALVLNETP